MLSCEMLSDQSGQHHYCFFLFTLEASNIQISEEKQKVGYKLKQSVLQGVYNISIGLPSSLSVLLCDLRKQKIPGFSFSATASTIRKSPSEFRCRSVRIFFKA